MTRREQKHFVAELTGNIRDSIRYLIETGKIPETWDGHELRHLIAELAERERGIMSRPRLKEYNNTVMVNQL